MAVEGKKRVLIFSTTYFPNIGGAEVAIKEITDRLPDYDFELICARLDSRLAKDEKIGRVLVHRLGFGHKLDKLLVPFLGVYKIWQINRARKINVFWPVMVTYTAGAAYIYNMLKFWRPIPVVLTLQEGDSEEHLTKRHGGLLDMSWRLAVPRSAAITALSKYLAERAKAYGAKGEPSVVPNGVGEDYFNVQREKMGKKTDGRIIVTTSRLVYKNAVDTLIRAMALLPEHKLLIAGDGEERANLENLAQELSLGSRIKFLGTVSREDLPELLAGADIFCRPSRSEGQGVSFMEAMAAGLPVIAPPVGGIPDFLTDGETGLFCKVDDPSSIALKVNLLTSDKKLRTKIVANAKKLMTDKYGWQGIAQAMSRVFELQLGKGPVVVIAAAIYPPDPGGPALHASKYFEEFPKHGLTCRLVAFRDFRKYPKGLSHLFYAFALAKISIGADLIYAHDALSSGLPAATVSKIFGLPLLLRTGGDLLWERSVETGGKALSLSRFYEYGLHNGQVKYFPIKIVLDRAAKIVVPAQIIKDVYVSYYNQSAEKVVVIPNPA